MFSSKALWDVVSQPFKRSQGGLFQGKTKQYGNNVPFSKHKTRRTWLPNVQLKRLPSEIMGDTIRVKVTTRALKTIKKVHEPTRFHIDCIVSDLVMFYHRKVVWTTISKLHLPKFWDTKECDCVCFLGMKKRRSKGNCHRRTSR